MTTIKSRGAFGEKDRLIREPMRQGTIDPVEIGGVTMLQAMRRKTSDKSKSLADSVTLLLGILDTCLKEAGQAKTLASARAKIIEADHLASEIKQLAMATAEAIDSARASDSVMTSWR